MPGRGASPWSWAAAPRSRGDRAPGLLPPPRRFAAGKAGNPAEFAAAHGKLRHRLPIKAGFYKPANKGSAPRAADN
ncbi:MAG: hypothetical protein LBT39_01250 [Treponema sp.]|nr:hypothetical protein [Treponema sp.]